MTKQTHINRRLLPSATAAALAALIAPLAGQGISTPAPTGAAASPTDVTVLSPYVVDTTQDLGYQATNTLSGTRLNSSLRDAPASISVMTKEFLEDIGL